jgi:hypothetical protein
MTTTQAMTPPTAHLPKGSPLPTPDDPTADGALCGARRKATRVEQDLREGRSGWPWCGQRAGHGTDHPGSGRCAEHLGNTQQARRSHRLRLAELAGPAIETLARVMVDPQASTSSRVRAAEALLDRAGYPRRLEIDTEAARETLLERLEALQAGDEAAN